ncbi:PDZ domain-containing protein [Bacillus sp. HMF5848]|uniref:PDZ domain-containing protein n=1 Tax=Bacillus sp. HMF5848 TaxID=2495421 RepID=UPI000F7A6147|nr:PDZ domain-containing protein [Bacillus sp. HMF5848]RSK28596.1 PDZ domain-containing protein [Bacillus sp. HMF5848]
MDWLQQLVIGIFRLVINPFLYVWVLAAVGLGYFRVKRERRQFGVRVQYGLTELRYFLSTSVFMGLAVSLVALAVGIVVTPSLIILILTMMLIFFAPLKMRWASPAFTLGVAILVAVVWAYGPFEDLPISDWFAKVEVVNMTGVAILLAILVLAEGVLLFKSKQEPTSPFLFPGKRGLVIGSQLFNRLWLVPVFLLIPGEGLASFPSWWPIFAVADTGYSIICVPFAIGFYQKIVGQLSGTLIKQASYKVMIFGVALVGLAISGLVWPSMVIVTAVVAVLGREAIFLYDKLTDEAKPAFFTRKNNGVVILSVLPHSPADKMALQIGEVITRVNGEEVGNEQQFYEALQINRAYCKIEVLNKEGELRYVQRALYEGQHHELGLLFVPDSKRPQKTAIAK